MNTTQNKPIFSTDNFALAVYLKTKACICLHVSKDNPRHATFNFEDNPLRASLTDDYWQGKASVEPKSYHSNERELKAQLYDSSYVGESK